MKTTVILTRSQCPSFLKKLFELAFNFSPNLSLSQLGRVLRVVAVRTCWRMVHPYRASKDVLTFPAGMRLSFSLSLSLASRLRFSPSSLVEERRGIASVFPLLFLFSAICDTLFSSFTDRILTVFSFCLGEGLLFVRNENQRFVLIVLSRLAATTLDAAMR